MNIFHQFMIFHYGKKKAQKISQGRMSYDDSELENEENQIHVISGNDHMHPFGPQIQESKL